MKRIFMLVLGLGFIFAGCAQKTAVQPEKPAVQQETAQKASEPVKEEQKATPAKKETPAVTEEISKKVETVPVKEVVEAKPAVSSFENIHFDFDKYNIRDDAKPTLKAVSDYLLKNNSIKMFIEGHCDERGTNEYNLALGERRAKSTRDYILSSGIKKDRLEMISYGEERPICKEQNDDCWQKNRRAQFVLKDKARGTGK